LFEADDPQAMAIASEIEPVAPDLSLWRVYDPAVKAELYSTAITVAKCTYLIDPVPLTPDALAELCSQRAIKGVIVTNENHHRAAADFAKKFETPIYFEGSQPFPPGLTPVPIEGAVPGEIAVHSEAAGGVMIMGDALINFEPYGFTFLPAKYCSNLKLMRRSLPKLVDYSFERMFFAHGTPILAGAHRRLEQLLENH
jgi:metallo-beta-lactamase superfamily protein